MGAFRVHIFIVHWTHGLAQMIQIDIDPASAPLGPHQIMAHFPDGRPGFTTKAMVGMTQIAREHAQVSAPKIYGYYDNKANPVKAEVVLMEYVRLTLYVLRYWPLILVL